MTKTSINFLERTIAL